jgi:hypothetical protein
MGDITDRIFQGSGKSPIRRSGSGKAARKRTSEGEVGNQSKLMQKRSPKKRG